MPAFALTAAEIAAAEAAAIAAAEAAAIQAAQIAAAEAAAAAAAEAAAAQAAAQAGTQAAAQAGTQAATQAATTAANAATNQSVLQAIGAQGGAPASAAQMGGYGGVNGIQALAQEVGANIPSGGVSNLVNTTAGPTSWEQIFSQGQNIADTSTKIADVAGPGQGQYVDLSGAPAGQVSPSPITSVEIQPKEVSHNLDPVQQIQSQSVDFGEGFGETLGRGSYASPSAPPAAPPAAPPVESALDKYYSQRPMDMGGAQGMKSSSANASTLRPSGDPFYNINSGHIDQTLGRPGFGITDVAVEPSAMSSNLPAQPATGLQGLIDKSLAYAQANPLQTGFGAMSLYNMLNQPKPYEKPKYKSTFDPSTYKPYEPTPPNPPYRARYAGGGPIERMSDANAVGANTGYPMADINKGAYAAPYQTPMSQNVVQGASDTGVNPVTGEMLNFARGGISDLGGYSDYARGGRMLKGPGDGMSDDIPATIANKQPARLANEEFVIPADVVSHLGNGSSEAGAKALYKMMDRVRQARTGTKKQGKQINPEKYLA